MKAKRRGKLAKHEEQFIREHAGNTHPQIIANKLNRTIEFVQRYIALKCPVYDNSDVVKSQLRVELRQSMAWKNLPKEFDNDEIMYFEERFLALKEQFNDDVFASEEGQLMKAIKAEILMHRNLVSQKRTEKELERLLNERTALTKSLRENENVTEREKLNEVIMTVKELTNSRPHLVAEYEKLDRSHQEIMKSLKATREQRISKVENSKRSFLDVIAMLQEKDQQDRANRQIEQMKKATDNEFERLSKAFKYDDNFLDKPILSADTVDE